MIFQFGLRRVLSWSFELLRFQKRLLEKPSLLAVMRMSLPVEGIDVDGDGLVEKIRLRMRTSLISEGEIVESSFEVDGKQIDPELVEVKSGKETVKLSDVSELRPLILIPGRRLEVIIRV